MSKATKKEKDLIKGKKTRASLPISG